MNPPPPKHGLRDKSVFSIIPAKYFADDFAELPHSWKVHESGNRLHVIKETEGWSSVRALEPFPAFTFNRLSEQRSLFYYEVRIIAKRGWMNIGLAPGDFPLSDCYTGEKLWTFGISNWGNLFVDGEEECGYTQHVMFDKKGNRKYFFKKNVVGCGLLDLLDRGRHLFFTRGGKLFGKPVLLTAQQASRPLYPTVSALKTASIEVNLGGDLETKRFLFDTTNLGKLILDTEVMLK